jgi:hypothetical protein
VGAAAARGTRRVGRGLGQQATLRDALRSIEAREVVGRRRARAGMRAHGGGGNGGWCGGDGARRGERPTFIGAHALGDDG